MHTEFAVMCYGAAGGFVCFILFFLSNHINRVIRITATTLYQISVIILLIIYPGRIQHVAIFYVFMALLAVCVTLWDTQLAGRWNL